MASCLHPRYIKIDRRANNPLVYQSKTFRKYKECLPTEIDYVPVPCGKCINCLRNKQNAMVSRCLEESDKRGTFCFVTLTYNNDTMPVAQSLWRASKETGEIEVVRKGEIVSSVDSPDFRYEDREKLISMAVSPLPRYFDKYIDGFEDDEYVYFSRLTPSLNRRDPRLWIKRCRVNYKREFGENLDFSYVLIGEMGPRTCRPHYHLAFFGLSELQARYFTDRWGLGYTDLKFVNSINPDGTDGFAIASRYIGKYMSKGKFDCASVLDGSAIKPRVCQSKGIGKSLIDKLRPRMCCFDMFGRYDLDTLFCPSLGRGLNDNEIKQIVNEVPNRLCYDSSYGFVLPIPRLFRDEVFYHKKVRYVKKRKQSENGDWLCISVPKINRIPTALWCLVSASIREHFSSNDSAKFRSFICRYVQGQISLACDAFEEYSANCVQITEVSRETNYKNFLNNSKDGQ